MMWIFKEMVSREKFQTSGKARKAYVEQLVFFTAQLWEALADSNELFLFFSGKHKKQKCSVLYVLNHGF